jgi:hypothetical protein
MVALAAAGTLLLLAGYETWQRRQQASTAQTAPAQKPVEQIGKAVAAAKSVTPPDALSAAHAVLGPDGEVLASGNFSAAGGWQVLAVQRMPRGAGLSGGTVAPNSQQDSETSAEVIRVSILVLESGNWKEALRADEHLKNRRGYLPGAPAEAVPAWHLVYSSTLESGFRLEFTPAGLPPARKQTTVYAAWNPKRGEYDAVKASGKGFLEISATPGNVPVPIKP